MLGTLENDPDGGMKLSVGENTALAQAAALRAEIAASLLTGTASPVEVLASLAALTGAAGRLLGFSAPEEVAEILLGGMLKMTGTTLSAVPAAHALFPIASGLYYLPVANASGMTAATMVAGKMDFIPFLPGTSFTCDRLELEVTTAVASSSVHLGVYADTGSGQPGALIDGTSTAIDTTTTGIKNSGSDVSVNFVAGTLYWLAILPSHAVGLRAVTAAGQAPLLQIAAGMANMHGFLRGTQSFGALPSTAPAIDMSNVINGAAFGLVRMRKQ